jgi:hypothetical protein
MGGQTIMNWRNLTAVIAECNDEKEDAVVIQHPGIDIYRIVYRSAMESVERNYGAFTVVYDPCSKKTDSKGTEFLSTKPVEAAKVTKPLQMAAAVT